MGGSNAALKTMRGMSFRTAIEGLHVQGVGLKSATFNYAAQATGGGDVFCRFAVLWDVQQVRNIQHL